MESSKGMKKNDILIVNKFNHDIEDFEYLLILDFEAQCQEGEKLKVQEIIEFPVIFYDLKERKVKDFYFHEYIKPKVFPILTQFCKELTGISQETVDAGVYIEDALLKFDEFLNQNLINSSKFTFVTCGNWDLCQCLRKEAKYKNIILKDYFKRWINVKNIFCEYIGNKKPTGMDSMLKELGLKLEGRHHSGIDDARNITKIVDKLIQKGFVFNDKYLSYVK